VPAAGVAEALPALDAEVRPPSPVRLPSRGGGDGVLRAGTAVGRLLHVDGAPIVIRAWRSGGGRIGLRAEALDPALVSYPGEPGGERPPAGRDQLETAIARARFMLWLDEDLTPFFRRFRSDPLLASVIHRKPWLRPRRRPWPWEALAWAITEQLIEASRASEVQRRMIRAWGPRSSIAGLTDVPSAATFAGRAPAELVSMDLSEARALALIRCAADTASGRADLASPDSDARLLSIREVGPWTVQCLALHGRGDPDALPAGDLAYIKLVGRLAELGRRATVEEVAEFFAPYAPYRGLAGTFALVGHRQPDVDPPSSRARGPSPLKPAPPMPSRKGSYVRFALEE
jgi:3-methyladenine DNA glycosylase/8-oxoguanine DNA glycosylase